MTALDKYIRLEALGIWREDAAAPPREVVISFGAATLVLTDPGDPAGRPLGHWALAGIQPVGHAEGATLYAMSADAAALDGEETLAIRDPEMIAALAAVSRDLGPRPDPRPSRRRAFPVAGLLLACLAAALAIHGPDLVRAQAARMVPAMEDRELGDRMLLLILDAHGPLCQNPDGARVLSTFIAALVPGATARVLDLDGDPLVAVLPGPAVLIDRAALASATGPTELARWIAQALGPNPARGAVHALMRDVGLATAVRYIFTGALSDAALSRAASAAIAPPPAPETFPPPADVLPALSPGDWARLRSICD